MSARWLPVVGFEGLYEVSDRGRVRSLPRRLSDGRRWKGRILKLDRSDKRGYLRVGLTAPGARPVHRMVHRLVLESFIGPCPPGLQCRHLNGKPPDCRLVNLTWGTPSENALDRVRHGTWVNNNRFVNATHCVNGHEFTGANTYRRPKGGRSCRKCAAAATRRYTESRAS